MKKISIVLIALLLIAGGYTIIQGIDKLIATFDKQKFGLLLICEDKDIYNNIMKAEDKINQYCVSDIKLDGDTLFIRLNDLQQLYEENILWDLTNEEFINKDQWSIDATSSFPILWSTQKDKQNVSLTYHENYSIGTGTPLANKIMIVTNDEYATILAKDYKLLFLNYRENPKLDMELYDYEKIQLTMIDN